MYQSGASKFFSFVLALLVHVGLLAFFVVNLDWFRPSQQAPQVEVVNAVVVDETKIAQEMDKLQKAEEQKRKTEEQRKQRLEEEAKAAEQKRVQEEQRLKAVEQQRLQEEERIKKVERQRKEEEQRAKEAEVKRKEEQQRAEKLRLEREQAEAERKRKAAEEKKRKEEEAKRKQKEQEEAERKRKEEAEKKKKAEAERKRKEQERAAQEARERALQEQLEQEAQAMNAAARRAQERMMIGYRDAIRQDVERAWRKPPNATPDMSCVVSVRQIPGGEVADARIVSCNTNDQGFQQSVVAAVHRASPLPVPPDPALFQREIEFTFSPRE